MIQKTLRCTLGIFSGNIYFDIANKPDRRVWLVCCSTEWAWRKSAFVDGCQLGYPYIFPTIFPRAAAGRSLHKRLRNLYCCQSVRARRNGGFACRVEGLERNVRYGSNGASSGNNDHLVVFSHHDFPPENVDLVQVYRIAGWPSILIAGSWKSTGINLRKFSRRLVSLFYIANAN